MSTVPSPIPPAAIPAAGAALWRLAYAITGDRTAAEAVVAEAYRRLACGRVPPARLRGEVVALARARVARPGVGAGPHRDRLWTVLRPLPRRRRADIVQRLHAAGSVT